MKNKKGFTLTEILAVIVILGIVAAIAVGAYLGIRKSILNTSLENLVIDIELAANDYAAENGNSTVTVKELVEMGYLKTDGNGEIKNPVNNANLMCQIVEIDIVDGEYKAKLNIVDENVTIDENGGCIAYIETKEDNSLELVCKDSKCGKSGEWNNGKFTLELSRAVNTENVVNYKWTSDSGYYSEKDEFDKIETVNLDVNGVLNTSYTLTLTYSDGKVIKHTKLIKIDNEKPEYISISKNEGWTSESKSVVINATDNNGSDIKFYYVESLGNKKIEEIDCENIFSKNKGTSNRDVTLENGKYFVCLMDNVGNISDAKDFEVSNIDAFGPILNSSKSFVSEKSIKGSLYYSVLSRRFTFSDELSGVSNVKYCITTDKNCKPDIDIEINKNTEVGVVVEYQDSKKQMQRICVNATDSVGNISDTYCDVNKENNENGFLYDATAPDLEISNIDNNQYIEIKSSDAESNIDKYSCKFGLTKDNLSQEGIVSSDGISCNLGLLNPVTKYYVEITSINNAGVKNVKKLEFTSKVMLEDAYNDKCEQNEYCDNTIYVKIGAQIFGLYRNIADGYKGLDVDYSKYSYSGTIEGVCCDNGQCTESSVAYNQNKLSTFVNTYVSAIPYYNTKLNRTNYCIAPINSKKGVCSKLYYAYGGMLDYDEFKKVKSYTGLFKYTKTTGFLYLMNRPTASYSGLASYYISGGKAVYGLENPQKATTHGYVKPVVVFIKSDEIISGSGTYTDPYVV